MCKTLYLYSLGPGVVAWCKDNLSHRQQCVKVASHKSSRKNVNYGVPQESILGPLFFIMYVNDLLELFSDDDVQILMCADDTVIYFALKNVNAACMKVEVTLRTISKWCEINKLTINDNKTKHMLVPQ